MNVLDLIVCLVLAVAVWNGWRRGFILQVCSLAAIVVAIWLAARFGAAAGALLRLDPDHAAAAGFVAVLVLAVLAVSILARLLRGIFRFAGFGLPDILLGIALAVLKYLLLLGALFAAIDRINVDGALVPAETIASSRTFAPVRDLSRSLLPFAVRLTEEAGRRMNGDTGTPGAAQQPATD